MLLTKHTFIKLKHLSHILQAWPIIMIGMILIGTALGCGSDYAPSDSMCDNLCRRLLGCGVTIRDPSDPDDARIKDGSTTELESCQEGCLSAGLIDEDRQSCILSLPSNPETPESCQADAQTCFES